jgi:hypothetical protein
MSLRSVLPFVAIMSWIGCNRQQPIVSSVTTPEEEEPVIAEDVIGTWEGIGKDTLDGYVRVHFAADGTGVWAITDFLSSGMAVVRNFTWRLEGRQVHCTLQGQIPGGIRGYPPPSKRFAGWPVPPRFLVSFAFGGTMSHYLLTREGQFREQQTLVERALQGRSGSPIKGAVSTDIRGDRGNHGVGP